MTRTRRDVTAAAGVTLVVVLACTWLLRDDPGPAAPAPTRVLEADGDGAEVPLIALTPVAPERMDLPETLAVPASASDTTVDEAPGRDVPTVDAARVAIDVTVLLDPGELVDNVVLLLRSDEPAFVEGVPGGTLFSLESDGHAHIAGLRGSQTIELQVAARLGDVLTSRAIELPPDGPMAVELHVVGRSAALAGMVLDAHGAPVPGASVKLWPDSGQRLQQAAVVTGEDGRFAFSGLRCASVSLHAWRDGLPPVYAGAVGVGSCVPVILRLDERAALVLHLRDEAGEPVIGLRPWAQWSGLTLAPDRQLAPGDWCFTNLPLVAAVVGAQGPRGPVDQPLSEGILAATLALPGAGRTLVRVPESLLDGEEAVLDVYSDGEGEPHAFERTAELVSVPGEGELAADVSELSPGPRWVLLRGTKDLRRYANPVLARSLLTVEHGQRTLVRLDERHRVSGR